MASTNLGSPALSLQTRADSTAFWDLLSVVERLLAGIVLAGLLPVLLLASAVIVTLSRRSPLVAHQRVGLHGQLFWVLKLRTMWKGDSGNRSIFVHRLSAAEAPLLPPGEKHRRVTSRFAALCRRYSIDELPQLWHVVTGEMSLVGPRPLTRLELDRYYSMDARRVLSKRPGLSGLWQIKGRSRLTYRQRRRLDLFLVNNWSISLYLRILFATVPRVLAGKDAW